MSLNTYTNLSLSNSAFKKHKSGSQFENEMLVEVGMGHNLPEQLDQYRWFQNKFYVSLLITHISSQDSYTAK